MPKCPPEEIWVSYLNSIRLNAGLINYNIWIALCVWISFAKLKTNKTKCTKTFLHLNTCE